MNDDRSAHATRGDLHDLGTELKGEMNSLRGELNSLKSEVNSLQVDVSSLKSDVSSLKEELLTVKGDVLGVKADLQDLRNELIETIRDSQTELLKAFYGFTQTVRDRFQEADQTEASLKRRLGTLESRMLEVEKRLNMPPAA
jgi:chromosome segregation ATPase